MGQQIQLRIISVFVYAFFMSVSCSGELYKTGAITLTVNYIVILYEYVIVYECHSI